MDIIARIKDIFSRKQPIEVDLSEVFGISRGVPQYTYVDRSNLDERFRYLLGKDTHIVIHGASKQGKTVLRKKNLPETNTVVVQCSIGRRIDSIYDEILLSIGANRPRRIRSASSARVESEAKVAPPGGQLSSKMEVADEHEVLSDVVGTDTLNYLATKIRESGKRIIIEDFHYLSEKEQQRMAFDLKALWDMGIFFVIVGVWAEQNLLTYYNGDLSGRVEEIDVQWSDYDLEKVITKGEQVLNVHFSDKLRDAFLKDANQNVGLLQRILEKYCYYADVRKTQEKHRVLSEEEPLHQARESICKEEERRYQQFFDAIQRGYRDSELKVYKHVLRVVSVAEDKELKAGIPRDELLRRVKQYEPRIRLSDLSAALNKLNKLQVDRQVSPLVLSYNSITSAPKLQLVDREFLFFRKYGHPSWPWANE